MAKAELSPISITDLQPDLTSLEGLQQHAVVPSTTIEVTPTHERNYALHHMPLEEVGQHLDSLSTRYGAVKKHYTGPIGRLRWRLKSSDEEQLGITLNDLMQLSSNKAVIQEAARLRRTITETGEPTRTHAGAIDALATDVLDFGKHHGLVGGLNLDHDEFSEVR